MTDTEELIKKALLTTPEWEKLHKEWEDGEWFGYCWEDVLIEAQQNKDIEHFCPSIEAQRHQWKLAREQGREDVRERIFYGTLQFHIPDRKTLEEVGEWAECQDVGVFVYFTETQWQALKSGGK